VLARRRGWQISHVFPKTDTTLCVATGCTLPGGRPLCKISFRGFIEGVGVRCFAMLLVALLMAWRPAVGHEVDPAVMAMFREWSITPPSPSGVFICHGFGCDFRTEVGLAGSDRAQMSAIMASGSASAEAERVAIGRTEAWFERRIAPMTGTAKRGPAHLSSPRAIALNNSTASIQPTTQIRSSSFSTSSDCSGIIQLPRLRLGFFSLRVRTTRP
jgi:hypothetical protein